MKIAFLSALNKTFMKKVNYSPFSLLDVARCICSNRRSRSYWARVLHLWRADLISIGKRESLLSYLSEDSLGVHGCLNATTDEFYVAREGFLPGYEIRPLQNIIVKQDSLSFTVEAGVEFDNPVPLYCKEEATAQRMGIPLWIQKRWPKPMWLLINTKEDWSQPLGNRWWGTFYDS